MVGPIAGVFPLTPSVRCKIEVDDITVWQMESGGRNVVDEVAPQLMRALKAMAETFAVDVSPECMLARHVGPGDHPFTQAYVAIWAPGVDAKAEMRGGHVDGEMRTVTRDTNGWPPPILRIAAPAESAVADYREAKFPGPSPAHPTYKLVGFRNEPAVWVYDLDA